MVRVLFRAALIAVGLAGAAAPVPAQFGIVDSRCADTVAIPDPDQTTGFAFTNKPKVVRLWFAAVQAHIPGCADEAAKLVASWPRQHLDLVVSLAHGFYGNETVKRGAVLHADIAALVGDDLGPPALRVEDGRHHGDTRGSVHWEIGRRLLDSVTPSPGDDADVFVWYRATSAYLLDQGLLNQLPAHLSRARPLFPGRAVFLIASGYFHERLGSPAIQAAVDEMRTPRVDVQVGSRAVELGRAERFFRQAADVAPDDPEVRLRLGHVTGALGRHEQAAAELRRAIALRPNRPRLYLAELFLGRELEALGRQEDAKHHYENAAALYPKAQSPWLALSHLAHRRGDRAAALQALQRITVGRSFTVEENDPRWFYSRPHYGEAESLMDQMRAIAGPGR